MNVEVNYVKWLHEELKKINQAKLEDLVLYKDGVLVEIDEACRKGWKYMGLTNDDFILTHCIEENIYE